MKEVLVVADANGGNDRNVLGLLHVADRNGSQTAQLGFIFNDLSPWHPLCSLQHLHYKLVLIGMHTRLENNEIGTKTKVQYNKNHGAYYQVPPRQRP